MNVIGSRSNHFKIIIMLFVVIFGISFLTISLLENTAFGYDKEKMIDKDYVYNKT